jgi:hypothetical protein
MSLPREFFTFESMLTLTGATGATFVVANGLQKVINFNPRWLALVIAQVICIFGVYSTNGAGREYFVGVINGFLVFCTATGATSVAGTATPGEQRGVRAAGERRGFRTPWF